MTWRSWDAAGTAGDAILGLALAKLLRALPAFSWRMPIRSRIYRKGMATFGGSTVLPLIVDGTKLTGEQGLPDIAGFGTTFWDLGKTAVDNWTEILSPGGESPGLQSPVNSSAARPQTV